MGQAQQRRYPNHLGKVLHEQSMQWIGASGAEAVSLAGLEKYVIMMCTNDCKMHFHHGCYKEVERPFKEAQSQWKLKASPAAAHGLQN